jgi:hypothetical protein
MASNCILDRHMDLAGIAGAGTVVAAVGEVAAYLFAYSFAVLSRLYC